MKSPKSRKPLFERLRIGLEEGILHAKGEITLKTTTLEMPDRPPEVEAEEVTKLRLKNEMSHAVFAQVLNVSTKTVQSWKQVQRKPSQAASRLIQVFRHDPSGLLELVGMSARIHGSARQNEPEMGEESPVHRTEERTVN
jgi:putative transcriptional regulator